MTDTDELIAELRKRYPEVPESSLITTLETCDYDLHRAIKAIEAKFYNDEEAIQATASVWSSVFPGPSNGQQGEVDWGKSLLSFATGVEHAISSIEDAVQSLGYSIAAAVQDVGDFVFGAEGDEDDMDASRAKEDEDVVKTAGSRAMGVKRRTSGAMAGAGGTILPAQNGGQAATINVDDVLDADDEWNDKLD